MQELHHLILYFLNKCSAPALKFQKCISLVHRVASHTHTHHTYSILQPSYSYRMWIAQHVNILFRSWRENIVYQVACIMYVYDGVHGGSGCGAVCILSTLWQTMDKNILLNIQQASRSCIFFLCSFPFSFLSYWVVSYPYLFSVQNRVRCIMQPYVRSFFFPVFLFFYFVENVLPHIFSKTKNIFYRRKNIVERILPIITVERKEIILFKNVSVYDCIDIIHVGRCKIYFECKVVPYCRLLPIRCVLLANSNYTFAQHE